MTLVLLAGDHLAPETPSPLPQGEEDLGEAFDFEDSEEEEEEEEDSVAEPRGEAVLRAPPRRRRTASSSVGEGGRQGVPDVPTVSPSGAQGGTAASLGANAISLCFSSLQMGWCQRPRKGTWDSGGILGGFESLKGESTALGFVPPFFGMSQPGTVSQFPQLLPIACERGCKQESPRVLGCPGELRGLRVPTGLCD